MATLTGTRGVTGFPVAGVGMGGDVKVAYGTYTFAANPSGADVVRECWVPKGAYVFGGWIQGADIDTGTEALDIDFGWEANGDEVADPDGFGNFGTWDGDAVAGIKPEAGILFFLGGVLFTAGPKHFTALTRLSLTVNTAANSGGTGQVTVVVLYVMEY